MFDTDAKIDRAREVYRREGDAPSRIDTNGDVEPTAGRDAAWYTWLVLSGELMDLGFTREAMCESLGTVGEVREEFASKARTSV